MCDAQNLVRLASVDDFLRDDVLPQDHGRHRDVHVWIVFFEDNLHVSAKDDVTLVGVNVRVLAVYQVDVGSFIVRSHDELDFAAFA